MLVQSVGISKPQAFKGTANAAFQNSQNETAKIIPYAVGAIAVTGAVALAALYGSARGKIADKDKMISTLEGEAQKLRENITSLQDEAQKLKENVGTLEKETQKLRENVRPSNVVTKTLSGMTYTSDNGLFVKGVDDNGTTRVFSTKGGRDILLFDEKGNEIFSCDPTMGGQVKVNSDKGKFTYYDDGCFNISSKNGDFYAYYDGAMPKMLKLSAPVKDMEGKPINQLGELKKGKDLFYLAKDQEGKLVVYKIKDGKAVHKLDSKATQEIFGEDMEGILSEDILSVYNPDDAINEEAYHFISALYDLDLDKLVKSDAKTPANYVELAYDAFSGAIQNIFDKLNEKMK